MTLNRCIEDLLINGCDDWIDACEVGSIAIQAGGAKSKDEVRELSLKMIRHVLAERLMDVGNLTRKGFRKWNMPVKECLNRIEREWVALGSPSLGDICWLQNTEKGDTLGNKLYNRRLKSP